MRIGDSSSASYRRLKAREYARNHRAAAHWCERLDALVEQAERFARGTKSRDALMVRADRVREKLRAVDH